MAVKISHCVCKKCGHKWVPRIKDPTRCPGCGTAVWNKPRKK